MKLRLILAAMALACVASSAWAQGNSAGPSFYQTGAGCVFGLTAGTCVQGSTLLNEVRRSVDDYKQAGDPDDTLALQRAFAANVPLSLTRFYSTNGGPLVSTNCLNLVGSGEGPSGIIWTGAGPGTTSSFTGSIAINANGIPVLTTSAVTGTIVGGQMLTYTSNPAGIQIISQLTGTVGGAGTYALTFAPLSGSQSSIAMTGTLPAGGIVDSCVGTATGSNQMGQVRVEKVYLLPQVASAGNALSIFIDNHGFNNPYSGNVVVRDVNLTGPIANWNTQGWSEGVSIANGRSTIVADNYISASGLSSLGYGIQLTATTPAATATSQVHHLERNFVFNAAVCLNIFVAAGADIEGVWSESGDYIQCVFGIVANGAGEPGPTYAMSGIYSNHDIISGTAVAGNMIVYENLADSIVNHDIITAINPSSDIILVQSAPFVALIDNQIINVAATPTSIGADIAGSVNNIYGQVRGNIFQNANVGGTGVKLGAGVSNWLVTNNVFNKISTTVSDISGLPNQFTQPNTGPFSLSGMQPTMLTGMVPNTAMAVEDASTNLLTFSDTFTNGAWTVSNTNSVLSGSIESPDGTADAYTVTSTVAGGYILQQPAVVADTKAYTASIYINGASAATAAVLQLTLVTGGTTVTASVTVNPATGLITASTGPLLASGIQPVSVGCPSGCVATATQWYRVWITAANVNDTVAQLLFQPSGTGTSSAIVFGAQLEKQPLVTSYIPTLAAAVSRPVGSSIGPVNASSVAMPTGGPITPSQLAGIVGTTTNNSANAGSVGEYVASDIPLASVVTLATGTPANVTSVSLTAGDWECGGNIQYSTAGTTTVTSEVGWISTTSAALPAALEAGGAFQFNASTAITGVNEGFAVGPVRESLASTTTVFLSTQSAFGTSTNKAYGLLRCRRVR